jgi:GT2 family glycosyltransferase
MMQNSYKNVYAIVLNYNCWDFTIECLDSLLDIRHANLKIILVDNDSTDNSINLIKSYIKEKLSMSFSYIDSNNYVKENNLDSITNNIILMQTGNNMGFASGNNFAIKYILNNEKDDAFIWLVNPDIVVDKESLYELIECFGNSSTKIIGSIVKNYNNKNQVLFYGGFTVNKNFGFVKPIQKLNQINKIDYVGGGNLFTNLNTFKKIGLLPEEYFLYWEETDWCTQAKNKSINLILCKNSISFDKGGSSINRTSPLAEYYFSRNALVYTWKFYKVKIIFAILFSIFRILVRLVYKNDKNSFYRLKALVDFFIGRHSFFNDNFFFRENF